MRPLRTLLILLCAIVGTQAATLYGQSADDELDQAKQLDRRAMELNEQGKTREALPLSKQVYATRLRLLGAEHLETATAANNVGLLLMLSGEYAAAKPYLEKTLAIRKKALGINHAGTALSLQNLAALLRAQGDLKAARPYYEESLAVYRRIRGEQSKETALALNNLGVLMQSQGDFAGAKTHFEQALAINRKLYGEMHLETGNCLANLGSLLREQADYESARPILEQALRINRQTAGEDHPKTVSAYAGLGLLYESLHEYPAARVNYEQALAICRRIYGEEEIGTATAWNNLGGLLGHQGDYAGARSCYEKALAIRRKVQGDHQDTSVVINNLGWLFNSQGDYKTAYKYYDESLQMARKVLGEDHPSHSFTLNGMGWALKEQEDYEGANRLYEEALRIHRKTFDDENLLTATFLGNFGELRREQGKFDEARKFYEQTIRIRRNALGDTAPELTGTLRNLAILEAISGNWEAAGKAMDQARRNVRRHVTRVLPALSDREQLTYLQANEERSLHRALSLGLTRAADPSLASLSAAWLINGKGTAQEAIAARSLLTRDSRDPKLAGTVTQLNSVRRELAMRTLTTPKAGQQQAHRAALERLDAEEARLTRELASQAGPTTDTAWVEIDQVRRALDADTTFINFARFPVYHVLEKVRRDRWQAAHYAAWIIPAVGKGEVQIVDLGPAEAIDQAVEKARDAVIGAGKASSVVQTEGEAAGEKAAAADLQRASDLIWKPLAEKLGQAKRLVLSPDGALWLLPWSTLPVAADRYLIEQFPLQYVVSGREFLHQPQGNLATSPPVIFADPDFNLLPDAKRQAIRAVFPKDPVQATEPTRGIATATTLPSVARLANTAVEAQLSAPSIARVAGADAQLFLASYALESAAKRVLRPKLLLFATHGFFLPDQEIKADAEEPASEETRSVAIATDGKPIENPLLRCGLLLTGCNAKESTGGDDGVLTGMEIVGMDLRGTELVVLSACETGLGKVNNGEGVAGLRQAFQLAGANAVVSTLWQVPDRDSALIMNDFFANLAEGQTKADALRNAQLKRIAARRERYSAAHPFFWAAWTVTGR